MLKKLITGISGGLMLAVGLPLIASAASNVVVTQTNTQGWTTADTRPGGEVNFIIDNTSPAPNGALQLTTDATTTSKAQYLHESNTPISRVNTLSYYTKQVSASFPSADPSYQLPVNLNGSTGFTTLVYEPYQNGVVTPGSWQKWDVDAGQFWSSRSVTCSNGAVVAGGGGAPFYSLSQIKTMCPEAVVVGYGVNVGSNNPSYNVETDLFNFNGTTYDFQAVKTPTHRDQCKTNQFHNYTNANGQPFKNEGQCIGYVSKHNHAIKGNISYTANGLKRHAEFEMNTADNRGTFEYTDANHDNYRVRVSDTNSDENFGYFAGEVVRASNPSWVGQWLFAKVEDNHPDKISGDFTTETAAKAGVDSKSNPASGPFNVTGGNLSVRQDD